MPTLSHRIELMPTADQVEYFQRACGTARRVWNWGLAEWNRQYRAGERPSAMALKKQFNAIKYSDPGWLDEEGLPWLKGIHRDAHARPFANLGKAWSRYFAQLAAGARSAPDDRATRRRLRAAGVQLAYPPTWKKKGRCEDRFYIANDKLSLSGREARLPLIGRIPLREALRFEGKVMGASVSRSADRWYLSVQVEAAEAHYRRRRTGDGITGVDLGVRHAAVLSCGEAIEGPKPLQAALRRIKLRNRAVSRKVEAARAALRAASGGSIPKGTRLPVSGQRRRAAGQLARTHARAANIRRDFTHKLTTRLCRENQAVVLEDLNVSGMLANERLARTISDVGFGMIRAQMQYKAARYGTQIVMADRFYPSSKLCSACGFKNSELTLSQARWICPACGADHDRDHNAAINLQRLATATALPVASPTSNGGAVTGIPPVSAGKVTPVRYEGGQQGVSGQEENSAHVCARFR